MIQCCGQVIWVPVHLVLIEPGLKLVLRLESLVTTFEDCTYIRCQHVVLVIGTDAFSHQVLRVHRVWLPLCPHEMSAVLEPAQSLGQVICGVRDPALSKTLGQFLHCPAIPRAGVAYLHYPEDGLCQCMSVLLPSGQLSLLRHHLRPDFSTCGQPAGT